MTSLQDSMTDQEYERLTLSELHSINATKHRLFTNTEAEDIATLSKKPDNRLSWYLDVINYRIKIAHEHKLERASLYLGRQWREVVAARLAVNWPEDYKHSTRSERSK